MYRPHPLDRRLADLLPAGSLFAVGGRVRDEIRADVEGTPPPASDLDYVVLGVPLDDLVARLRTVGRADLVGAAFSVIKLTIGDTTVDVALPRRERSVGAGHRDFEVQSGPEIPLEDDLARRDFRMNMIARAVPSGELVDPYGGETDIGHRRIDILTPAAFEEDPLRMLRAAQFAARFGYEPTPATVEAMRAAAALTPTVSAERIAEELTKLLARAPRPSIGFELLRSTGVLAEIWPELLLGVGVEQNEWHAYDVWHHAMATVDASSSGDLTLRSAALLHDIGKPMTKQGPHFYRHELVGADLARAMLSRLRFPHQVVDTVEMLVRQHMFAADPDMTDAAVRRFIRRVGPNETDRLFALREADVVGSGLPKRGDHNERFAQRVRAEIARKPAFAVTDLAVGGDDVVAALVARGAAPPGFAGDARVGEALRWLFEQVTDVPERNERTTLLGLLEQHLDARGAAAQASGGRA